jgi:beta-glucosidase
MFIPQLSLTEKLSLLSGKNLWSLADIPRLDIPSLLVCDGPHGVRKGVTEIGLKESFPATCFPTASALACSWDEGLLKRVGQALSRESLHYNISILLGPGMNIKRHPAGGRNFEYFSEDPLLSGRLAAALVTGIQETGQVGACLKHFCVNNQESHRFVVDAIVDERSLREIYYKGFEIACKSSQPATIMSAYNKVNGVFASEHEMNTHVLRDQWGFEGIVMTDWGATNDRVAAISAGMDLEMPGSYGAHDRDVRLALKDGRLDIKTIDLSVKRMLSLIKKYQGALTSQTQVDWDAHAELARQAARDCIVLLQNRDNVLPLARQKKVALIGEFAKDNPRFQGMGSSQINARSVLTAFDCLGEHCEEILYAPGYKADSPTDEITQELLDEAVQVAQQADVVVLVRS